ncbi:LCP family protein [Streptomyces gobiensis]|uniref:LCP family protein n=1 Tax=Streptomyces gobiensis TaxID=2875706 RepID=UPI001E553F8B|nr:LCP family protein [Streptomyces gobiensis]UGY91775.1 LCP family protein [Streptomyces gobiensis]
MDAQGRGHAGDIDPADQWVYNPSTNSYELRLNPSADQPRGSNGARPGAPRSRRAAASPASSSPQRPARSARPSRSSGSTGGEGDADRRLPGQRSRRAGAGNGSTGHSRRKPRAKPSGKQRVLRWSGGILGLLLISGCATVYWAYRHFNDNIDKVDVGIDNKATSNAPVNILIIGTDARTGEGNQGYGDRDNSQGHADTTLLLHVSKDRSHATALSIPRDMVTTIPDCPTKQSDGTKKVIPGQENVRFNESLGQLGRDPGCTWRTVEELTGLKINHFMMADFDAVKTLSSAVGGVEVCVAKDINDKKSHLKLKAGTHRIEGEDALAFVRTRDSVGFGSDLSRIELQQQFLSSMFRQMKDSNTLGNPKKAWGLAEAATDALTVDTNIGNVPKLLDLAQDLQRVNPKNITFVTVPVLDNPTEKVRATVILDEAKAEPLFQMLRADKSLAGTKKGKGKSKGEKVKKAPASEVRVDVYNGGGPIGAAQQTVDWLQNSKSVQLSTNAGNAEGKQARTTLEYGADQAGQAATLAEMMGLPKSALKKSSQDAGAGVAMTLTLGKDFSSAGTPIKAPDTVPDGVQNINGGNKNVCAK